MKPWRRKLALLVTVLALVAAACGDDGEGTGSSQTDPPDDTSSESTTSLQPVAGGVVRISQYSTSPGLDPVKYANSGTAGGQEMLAIYDTLMQYDPETATYTPRVAESLESNDDYSEWTLKLRSGLTFGDGTPLDAEAVKFAIEREMAEGNSSPRGQILSFVESVSVVDNLTVLYKLHNPWAGFPYLLSGVGGMVYSPTYFNSVGAEAFNLDPGPATLGPFRVETYRPGEILRLVKNPDYYGGEVYLDALEFITVGGADASYEALKAGTTDAGFFLSAPISRKADEEGYVRNQTLAMAGNMMIFNSGVKVACSGGQPAGLCDGKPDGEMVQPPSATADPRVRKAIAHAVDPEVVNQRAYDGAANPNSAPFAGSRWDPGIEGPKYDLEEAKRLFAEAKADGWDGKVRILAPNTPEGQAWALAVETQLDAAGIDATADTTNDTQGIIGKLLIQRDFDTATWALSMLGDADSPYPSLLASFNSAAPRYGYGNAEFDAAIDMLRTAATDEDRVAAFRAITELWVRDNPAHVITSLEQGLIHRPELHGVVRTAYTNYFWDKAWIEK